MPVTLPYAGSKTGNKIKKDLYHYGVYILMGRDMNKMSKMNKTYRIESDKYKPNTLRKRSFRQTKTQQLQMSLKYECSWKLEEL